MSFITKRERVFNEYDLFDLPARNEGKLKAYASCTDARAWSHFCSDKTEHLVEVIKRNNETIRPKYIPTEIIVNTLMMSKNAEMARLKRKIEELEQMIAAYDQLELTCEQKCDIANAHAAIRAANKELDEMCLDLDLSGFTECIDSEAFETGKSRGDELKFTGETGKSHGDEWNVLKESTPRMETKSNQFGESCTCDASTSVQDKRIDELQGTIICKDAKLSAMQNTIAVMENDLCEPYCVYAHINTALEKILSTLRQNEKYKEYLDLLTVGKDTRGIDIKGKILYKIKVLEKFGIALIAPCSENYNTTKNCACYQANIVTHVQATFALTSAESNSPDLDNKRAHLIADIMQSDDMKEILSKKSSFSNINDDQLDECFILDNCNINQENLNRLKTLQSNYDDLLNCYESLKYEKDCLNIRCRKYTELERECECLQNQLREYKELWKEKEYYKNRSKDLDSLKENFLILADETASIEAKLKAEQEINKVKSKAVDELRNENIKLDNKLTEVSVTCEKQKNNLICKLKEKDCKIMCQQQQIKSLSTQIDELLDKDARTMSTKEDITRSLELIDEIKSQKEQIKNLKDALCCHEEENTYNREEFEKQLEIVNTLKFEIEDWKSKYEKVVQTKNYLETCLDKRHREINNIEKKNKELRIQLEDKDNAIDNLNGTVHSKSEEISNLTEHIDQIKEENKFLYAQLQNCQDDLRKKKHLFQNEKMITIDSIHSLKQESLVILHSMRSYDNVHNEITDQNLTKKNTDTNDCDMLTDIKLLRDINLEIKKSFDLIKKQSEILSLTTIEQEKILKDLSESHERIVYEKSVLENDLIQKTNEADQLLSTIDLTNKKSDDLAGRLNESEIIHEDYLKLCESYKQLISDRNEFKKKYFELENVAEQLRQSHTIIKEQNQNKILKGQEIDELEKSLLDLNKNYDILQVEKNILQKEYNKKTDELMNVSRILACKTEECRKLSQNYITLKDREEMSAKGLDALKRENIQLHDDLTIKQKKNQELTSHLQNLDNDYKDLQVAYHKINTEKGELLKENEVQLKEYKNVSDKNNILRTENKDLLINISDLENALMHARCEKMESNSLAAYYENIKAEINVLKSEKLLSNKKIYELQEEIKKLQYNLDKIVESGEEMRKLSNEHLNKTLQNVETHHAKATHSMETKIAELQTEKADLENQLTYYEKFTQESTKEKENYISQINTLKLDRAQIISSIKELESDIFGESILSFDTCDIKKIIATLRKIGQHLHHKNKSLEKTIVNVQKSCEMLKSKAEEAKTIAEREVKNIINEKEEMLKERNACEKQLHHLQNIFDKDRAKYENSIKDLEGEILNQTLLFDSITQTKENEILKIENEKLSLEEKLRSSLIELKNAEKTLKNERDDKNIKQRIITDAELEIKEKDMKILSLQKHVEILQKKTTKECYSQTNSIVIGQKDVSTATEYLEQENIIASVKNPYELKHSTENTPVSKAQDMDINIDFIKYIYCTYKTKKLGPGKLEQHSIDATSLIENGTTEFFNSDSLLLTMEEKNIAADNVIDIYNANIITNFTKEINENDRHLNSNLKDSLGSSVVTDLVSSNDISHKYNFGNKTISEDSLSKHTDTFMIYKDSENSSYSPTEKKSLPQSKYTNVIVQRATVEKNHSNPFYSENNMSHNIEHYQYSPDSSNYKSEDDSVKPKLKINLPRVYSDNFSTVTLSGDGVDSPDSSSLKLRLSLNRKVISDTNLSINPPKLITNYSFSLNNDDITNKRPNFNSSEIEDMKKINEKFESKNKINDRTRQNKVRYQRKEAYSAIENVDTSNTNINGKTTPLPLETLERELKTTRKMSSSSSLILKKKVVKDQHFNTYIDTREDISNAQINGQSLMPSNKCASFELNKLSNLLNQSVVDRAVSAQLDNTIKLENKIKQLTNNLETVEKDYKNKLEAIKNQYEINIKHIISEHNHGVKSIQSLHEDRLYDAIKMHENEIESLRAMSIEAFQKVERLENDNRYLRSKLGNKHSVLDEVPIKILPNQPLETKKKKGKCRSDCKTLTKTNIILADVKPKRSNGPCRCAVDVNVADTVRNMFDQVDVEQRRIAEQKYLKCIANKILSENVDVLNAQELSFLHLKICRTWRTKLTNEQSAQRRVDLLESEIINKQRQAHKNIKELDRQVAEEWRRLQEAREAVCCCRPKLGDDDTSHYNNTPNTDNKIVLVPFRLLA